MSLVSINVPFRLEKLWEKMDLFLSAVDNKETGKDDGIVGRTFPKEAVANEVGHNP